MKEFEDRFTELQADMISICMEFVEDRADRVYVYASYEESIISSRFFYLINNNYVKSHRLNDAIEDGVKKYDVSPERGFQVLDTINDDIEKIKVLCEEFGKDMPTEMKLIFDVKSGGFKAEYKYEPVYTNHDTKTARQIADEWFEEIKSNNL
ncbi:immunity protein YezG family protein [Terribacillus sp. DMT04]|uniref:immunity protein YezG family protein n=1 Tax=Terribacillus sp. DMT04 TaxID=2850441 RepID=UPI001C2B9104|nr:immunity protein YezG family protein [Terribacillus sp. DMT04]QXE02895.1 DUF600 family protein [Terribacillus sp. DMT04]